MSELKVNATNTNQIANKPVQSNNLPKKEYQNHKFTTTEKVIGGLAALTLLGIGIYAAIKKGKVPKKVKTSEPKPTHTDHTPRPDVHEPEMHTGHTQKPDAHEPETLKKPPYTEGQGSTTQFSEKEIQEETVPNPPIEEGANGSTSAKYDNYTHLEVEQNNPIRPVAKEPEVTQENFQTSKPSVRTESEKAALEKQRLLEAEKKIEETTISKFKKVFPKIQKDLNIPENSTYTIEYLEDSGANTGIYIQPGSVCIKKPSGIIHVAPRYYLNYSGYNVKTNVYFPLPDGFYVSELDKLNKLGQIYTDSKTGTKYLPFNIEYETPELQEIALKYKELEKSDNIQIFSDSVINEFKEQYASLLDIIKIGKKDKVLYNPLLSGEGYAYVQKSDGSIIYANGRNSLKRLKPISEGEVIDSDLCEEFNGKKYRVVAEYESKIKNGDNIIVKRYVKKNGNLEDYYDKTVWVDKTRGEYIVHKDGYNYYFRIKDNQLLDIRKGNIGRDIKNLQNTYKSGNPPKDPQGGKPKVLLLQLVGGGHIEIYQMPNGTLIFPEDFHFPGSQLGDFLREIHQGAHAVGRAKQLVKQNFALA